MALVKKTLNKKRSNVNTVDSTVIGQEGTPRHTGKGTRTTQYHAGQGKNTAAIIRPQQTCHPARITAAGHSLLVAPASDGPLKLLQAPSMARQPLLTVPP
uniref:Uncharacterized protein n=1 Tax=Paramormyrops kingsleyae TaxID=1676925 RepID=A0A3B3RXF7_9TELE